MSVTITAIGNEGFEITCGGVRVFIDAFYYPAPWVGAAPARRAAAVKKADLILVTHDHTDHFHEGEVADVAARTGATVIGSARVIAELRSKLPGEALIELEPPAAKRGAKSAPSQSVVLPAGQVTAFRTRHSPDHNSYLIELPGFRCFHDGDNEDTRSLLSAALGPLDALFIGPWQGSGWVDFIETVRPARWFLMHLTEEELDQQAAGKFLPDLCEHVPANLIVLRPGESFLR
jgi:L-ascorbate metabolism protein UlaG (beta-lactamase superfamily)